MSLKTELQAALAYVNTKLTAKGAGTASTVYEIGNRIDAIHTGIEPNSVSGSTLNAYVADYLSSALANYPNDSARSSTYAPANAAPESGVRKDIPAPLTVALGSGELSIRDNSKNGVSEATVSGGTQSIYNVSKDGGDFILKANGAVADVGTLSATNPLRMIYAPSVYNVRDMGGWDTFNGSGVKEGTVKYGKLFRGGEINNNISAADKALFKDFLKIGCEIDFYLSATGENKSVLGDNVVYHGCHTAYHYKNLVDLDNATNLGVIKSAINAAFDAASNNLPLYFHCQVGADRTGTLAFILGAMLGMSEAELDIDWELTSFTASTVSSSLIAGWRTRNEASGYGAKYREMISYFKSCTNNPSSIRDAVIAWSVIAGIDISDINAFRQNMIDGMPETVTANVNTSVRSVSLNKSAAEIGVDETTTIVASTSPSWASGTVNWASDDASVATVSGGVVTGVAAGTANITASCNGHTASAQITVTQAQDTAQYTGNIVSQVGYTDGYRYNSSGGTTAGTNVTAINKIAFHLQNDGYFKLNLSGIDWTSYSSSCRLCLYKDDAFKAQVSMNAASTNATYGVNVTIDSVNHTAEILLYEPGSSAYSGVNQIAFSGAGAGADAVIEQEFPIQ